MAKWVIHWGNAARINTSPLLRQLAEDVASDARAIAPVRTGALRAGIHVGAVGEDSAIVVSERHVPGEDPNVPFYVERGTSKMAAQPYLRPALYRYRG